MNDTGNTIKHATISLLTCTILLILVYLSLYWEKTVFIYSEQYATEIGARIKILLIVLSVLISYIVYLLLSAKTRALIEADRLTRSLRTSIEQLNNIYEESPVPYMTLDKDGKIIDPNKATVRFFGAVPEQIKNKNIFSFISEDESERAEKLLLYYKSNLAINMEELRMVTPGGKVRWVILSVFKMEGGTGHGRVGLATIIDITDRKGLDKAKTEFVSLASHQLRTPAATIKWYADMMLAGDVGPLEAKQADYLGIIKKVNDNMIEIVETLLNVSRVEIGSISIDLKNTDVPKMIDDILLELSASIEMKGLDIVRDYDGNLENIETDPKLLRIVIQNLLSNAIKYTPKMGSVKITLKESFKEKSVTISDSGMGIPEEDKEKIFTKLFRASNVRQLSESQGTGLGLYLVKSIVEAMGGSIEFASDLNKGSTFIVKI